jgi:hypothetical protein
MPHKAVKKKPVAKKKRQDEIKTLMSPEAQRKAERALKKYVDEMDERSQERADYCAEILRVNGEDIREAVFLMVEQLRKMEGPPKVTYEGKVYNAINGETELLEKIQTRNFTWIAIRCLVACAEWGIRIGDFKLPADKCARCGAKAKPARKKKKRG